VYAGPPYLPIAKKIVSNEKATTVSSFMTYSSFEIAAMERPAADERIAAFETSEFPGSASSNDWALTLGSGCCEGIFDSRRTEIVTGGGSFQTIEGRRRTAPEHQWTMLCGFRN
jgi:hypothetical protein